MKGFGFFVCSIFMMFISLLINGFIYMEMYELALAPLLNYLGNAPAIPYGMFVLIVCFLSLFSRGEKTKYDSFDKKFWSAYLTIIAGKFILLGVTFMFNLMFV